MDGRSRVIAAALTAALLALTGLLELPLAVACHGQTVSCDGVSTEEGGDTLSPPIRTVGPGGSTEYRIRMTLTPGCSDKYYLYAELGSVPSGWTVRYTSGPGGTGKDYRSVNSVNCGSGNEVTVNAYLNLTAPASAKDGDTAIVTAMIGADDDAWNDKRLVYIETITKICQPNPPPVVQSPIADFEMFEDSEGGSGIDLRSVFSDPEGEPLNYSWEGRGNLSVTISDGGGKVVIRPRKDWNGRETLVFKASDGKSTVVDDVAVTVMAVEDLPFLVRPLRDFAVVKNGEDRTTVDLSRTFQDADTPYGDVLTFACSGNVNLTMEIDPGGKVAFRPLQDWMGREALLFSARDRAGNSVSDDVNVTVTDSNRPPYLKSRLHDISFPEDTENAGSIDLREIFADPDPGAVLSYGCEGNISVGVNISNGRVVFSPAADWNGRETISFWASDGLFYPVYDTMNVTVTAVNDAPRQKLPLELVFDEDTCPEPVRLADYFYDVDGDSLRYSASSSENLTVQIATQLAVLNVTPKKDFSGKTVIFLEVNDQRYTLAVDVPVTVRPVDDAPVIIEWLPGGNAYCLAGSEVSFRVVANDADGDAVQFLWTVDDSFEPLKAFGNQSRITLRANAEHGLGVGTYQLVVWATSPRVEGGGWSRDSHSWIVTVRASNSPPSVPVIRSPKEGGSYSNMESIQLEATATDPDGDNITYTWYVNGKETKSGQKCSVDLWQGTHRVKVIATDTMGASSESKEVSIEVKKANSSNFLPGFEGLFLVAAIGAALVVLGRKR